MNSIKKIAFVGGALIASGVFLASFTSEKGEDKNKKYQIIHYADGEMIEHDTVIPMSSSYTPEQFIVDKGITSENLEIIDLPSLANFEIDVKGMKTVIRDLAIGFEKFLEEIEISTVIDEDGNKTTKSTVNGIGIELMERIKDTDSKDSKQTRLIKMSFDDTEKGGNEERTEISVEVDKGGNKKITKTVNGEQVEMNDEELENFDMAEMMSRDNINLFIDGDFGEGLEVEIKKLEIELEKLIEGLEEEDEKTKIITRQIETNTDGDIGELTSENKENFTIVIVTENYNDETAKQSTMMFNHSSKEMNVYPNPNDGTFTIRYESDKNKKTSIKVNDATGKEVFQEKLGKFSGKYEKELNLKEFGSGMYTITIQNGNDAEVQKVMIK